MILIAAIVICIVIGGLTYFKRSPKAILITILLLLGAMICFFYWAASKEKKYGICIPAYFNNEKKDSLVMSDGGEKPSDAERVVQWKTKVSVQSESYDWIQKEETWQMSL
ncbi:MULTISPECIES: hypothetical protein [Chryseobacterium]|uniref:hypothetical protein n=1 Tax=Chryseobacterium TaxID=59732 RepID=UPI001296543E|nr:MULTISPECIES: hypothetical protein [Chryseobacterium]MDR6922602.1 hypothetical protein [Chryseobacterium sp. 2987]